MILSLSISGFKNHEDTRLELGQFTVIAGPNGAGKTNVLRALSAFAKPGSIHVEHMDFASRGDDFIGIQVLRGDRLWNAWTSSTSEIVWVDAESSKGVEADLNYCLRGLRYFKPSLEKLRGPSYDADIPPTIKSDGSEFASAVSHMMTNRPAEFQKAAATARVVLPWLKGIRADREKVSLIRKRQIRVNEKNVLYDEAEQVTGDRLVFDVTSAANLRAEDMSDGTLYLLAVIFLVHSLPDPAVILIDDIEQGLHPGAQRSFIQQLRGLLRHRKGLQIVATTHSPFVIDEFAPDSVWLLASDPGGMSRAKRLSDHPQREEALKVLTTGELWAAEGESWILSEPKRPTRRKRESYAS